MAVSIVDLCEAVEITDEDFEGGSGAAAAIEFGIHLNEQAARVRQGAAFEAGNLTLEDLRSFALENGEPATISGKQELMENIVNRFI